MIWGALVTISFAASCAPPPTRLIIEAGRFIDGTGAPAQTNVRLTIEEGLITQVAPAEGPLPQADARTQVIDARDATVMPGLVDTHVHLLSSAACTSGLGAGVAQIARNLRAYSSAGVTTVQDLAAPVHLAVAVRQWVGTARHRGPRVLVAGPMLTHPQGYMTDMMDGELMEVGMGVPLHDVGEATATVRSLRDAGVDVIKIGLQRRNYNDARLELLDPDILAAIVEEAHRQELRVVAHATENETYTLALNAGADAIVHGGLEPLESDLIEKLIAKNTVVAPTVHVFVAPVWGPKHLELLAHPRHRWSVPQEVHQDLLAYAQEDAKNHDHLPPFMMEGISRGAVVTAGAALAANLQTMHTAGVSLAFGSDSATCFNPSGHPVAELRRWAEAGVPPLEVLAAATSGGAKMLGLQDALGRLQVGYRGDVVVVEGRPDEVIEDLDRVCTVVVDGVVQETTPPSWWHTLSLTVRIAYHLLSNL